MMDFLDGRATERKLHRFAVACCRRAWNVMDDHRHRWAVQAADRHADGLLGDAAFGEVMTPVLDLWAGLREVAESRWEPWHYLIPATLHLHTGANARYADHVARGLARLAAAEGGAARTAEEAAQSGLLRDRFGDPPAPFRFDPARLAGAGAAAAALVADIYRGQWFGDPLLDVTSSSLNVPGGNFTKSKVRFANEINSYRVGLTYFDGNFGEVHIDWGQADPVARLRIRDEKGGVVLQQRLKLSQLQSAQPIRRAVEGRGDRHGPHEQAMLPS
jgi:hypothetical protein